MACCISRHPLIWWRSNNYFCVFKTLQLLLGETTLWGPHLGSRVVNRSIKRNAKMVFYLFFFSFSLSRDFFKTQKQKTAKNRLEERVVDAHYNGPLSWCYSLFMAIFLWRCRQQKIRILKLFQLVFFFFFFEVYIFSLFVSCGTQRSRALKLDFGGSKRKRRFFFFKFII